MKELKIVLTKLNIGESMTDEEVQGMLNEADLNGDGYLDYNGKQFAFTRQETLRVICIVYYKKKKKKKKKKRKERNANIMHIYSSRISVFKSEMETKRTHLIDATFITFIWIFCFQ